MADAKNLFDANYYATGCGMPYRRDDAWMVFFGGVAAHIVAEIAPASVLDAGCALGILVEQLRMRGVAADGVDISEFAIGSAHESVREYLWVGSVAEPFGKQYDLIVCIEVLEHMSRGDAELAVVNFCANSDDILFSSSPEDYAEPTHFNVNPPEYWAYLFAQQGFFRDVDFDATFLTPWAARFRRRTDPPARVLRDYERRFWEFSRESQELRRQAVAQREQLAAAAAAHAYAKRIEGELAAKNAHIARLEELLRRVENGRIMRLLRRFTQTP